MTRTTRPTTFTVQADRHLVRAGQPDERHILVRLTAPEARRSAKATAPARPGVNICFVLDRSGSMAGPKLELARYAVERALTGLAPQDRFAIVTYDDRVELVAKSAKATDTAKHQALVALQSVDPRGSTALHDGWSRGAETIKRHLDPKAVNRVLLLTDGLANRGETDPSTLAAFAADLCASGVPTSTFGVGADFDEALLQAIADAGGGHFYYIEHPQQIPDYMTGELGELLETVARGVVVGVKHAPGLRVAPLSPVAAKAADLGHLNVLLGDLVAGQDVELVLSVEFPAASAVGAQTTLFFTVADRDGVLKADGCTVDFESATAAACKAEKPNTDVERAMAKLKVAQARQESVRLNRAGQYKRASQSLQSVSAFLAPFDDAETRELRAQLKVEADQLQDPMSELNRKAIHSSGYNLARSRDELGRARRGGPGTPVKP